MNCHRFLSEKSIRLDIVPSWRKVMEEATALVVTSKRRLPYQWDEQDEFYCDDRENEELEENYQTEETESEEDMEVEEARPSKREKIQMYQSIASTLAELLAASGHVSCVKKICTALFNMSKRSAIGCGVAIPHVRLQTTSVIMGFARYTTTIDFDAPDGEPVQIFIPMIAPPYDDKDYRKLYSGISKAILTTNMKQELLEAKVPSQIIKILNTYIQG